MDLQTPQGIRLLRAFPWQDLVAFHRPHLKELAPARAGRLALGVAIPLLLGLWVGEPVAGIFAALGALPAGMASLQGTSRSRLEAILFASLGMAVSTFVGSTMANEGLLKVIPIALWAYVTGLSIALGNRFSVVALTWTVSMLISFALALPPGPAAIRSLLVLGGGLFQGALVIVAWVLWAGNEERQALSSTYALLAQYASSLSGGTAEIAPSTASPATEQLADPNPLISPERRGLYLDLLEEAVRLRASLAAVAGYVGEANEREAVRGFLGDVGGILQTFVRALGARSRERLQSIAAADRAAIGLHVPDNASWRWAGEALLGQVRAVTLIAAHLDDPRGLLAARAAQATVPSLEVRQIGKALGFLGTAFAMLRANMTTRTEAGQHALRLAVAAGSAELVWEGAGLSYGRWAVLTIMIVLKPDYASTVTRSVQRAVGTLLGAVLALLFIGFCHPGLLAMSLAATVAIAFAYVMFFANFMASSLFLTCFIVLVLDLLGLGPLATAEGRLGATGLGALWALAIYVLWPTWEGVSAPEKFARMVERFGDYLQALLDQLAHPARYDPALLRRTQEAARRSRSDAEAATERLAFEPPHPPLTPELARSVVAVASRLARGLLATQTLVDQRAGRTLSPEAVNGLDALAKAFRSADEQLATSLRKQEPPGPLPPLRPLQVAVFEQARGEPAVVLVTDALVDAFGSLGAVLRGDDAHAVADPHPAPSASSPVG